MTAERLFVIYGAGHDDIGLVGKITTALAEAGGNILDLRQDVLHGLFTIYLVVDFQASGMDLEKCRRLTAAIADQTSLALAADRFTPVPRAAEKKNLLLILVGEDKPGVGAKISGTLGRYQINIEFCKMIAREDVFLMELLVDCGRSALPLANLEREIVSVMAEMKISALVQPEDVFNKKKRLLVFSLAKSFLPPALVAEIVRQAGLDQAALEKAYGPKQRGGTQERAAAWLEGLSAEVLVRIAAGARPTPGTQELVQTLKTFGYRVALAAAAVEPLVARVASLLGIEAASSFPIGIDPDTKRLSVEAAGSAQDEAGFIRSLASRETAAAGEITVIRDAESAAAVPPGIRLDWDLKTILELHNQRVLTKDNLLGLIGGFGRPAL